MPDAGHPRLFVAALPPPAASARLAALARRVAATTGGRAEPADRIHLTLEFLGPVPGELVAPLAEALAGAVTGPAIPLRTGALRARPGARRARLVALELEDPDGLLADRAGRVRAAVMAVRGTLHEERPLWPHVTLTRRPPGRVVLPEPEAAWGFRVGRTALVESVAVPGAPARHVPRRVWGADP